MRIPSLVIAIVAASQLGATDCGQVLRDQGFDLWCGGELCAWTVERGSVKQVPTWNPGDHGVELEGTDTAIAQLTPADDTDGRCIEVTMVANIDPGADVELNIDLDGDGNVEYHERIPSAKWKPLTFDVWFAGSYRGIKFELAKTGAGTAQLANIGAKTVQGGCAGMTAIPVAPAGIGALCVFGSGSTCASGICESVTDPDGFFGSTAACAGCDDTHGCGSGEVCGLVEAASPVLEAAHGCIAVGSKQLGERCDVAAECAPGQCVLGHCSACDGSATCGCGPAWSGGPYVCGAGSHQGASGAPCGTGADCASGECDGTPYGVCNGDGRPCASPADCEFGTGSNGPLANGTCTPVGIQGGSCR